jgi:DNA/RNA-binding domain of Phe-tRNA-synthetase-like protein
MKMTFSATDAWKNRYPGAVVGMMAVGEINNIKENAPLTAEKTNLENALRKKISSRADAADDPIMRAYGAYYQTFRKSYHVLQQVESVAIKGRAIPAINALVTAMFMAELKNYLLTAGHDLDAVEGAVRLDIANGDERYIKLTGEEQATKVGDMMVADRVGVLSSILYGPDKRTRITEQTRRALFVVYGPAGVDEAHISHHMEEIFDFIKVFSPDAEMVQSVNFSA